MDQLCEKFSAMTLVNGRGEVLNTYELLESILLQLPIKDLFVAQRTCSQWRDIIAQSHALQRKMFLRADGAVKTAALRTFEIGGVECTTYQGAVTLNPTASFKRDHLAEWEAEGLPDDRQADPYSSKASFCNFYMTIGGWMPPHLAPGCVRIWINILHDYPPHEDGSKEAPSRGASCESASWRRMFISQPPVSGLRFHFVNSLYEHPRADRTIYNRSGITFGDIFDARQELAEECGVTEGQELPYSCELNLFETDLYPMLKAGKWEMDKDGECECLRRIQME